MCRHPGADVPADCLSCAVADDVTIRVEGLRELQRGLRAFAENVDDLKDANAAAARMVASSAAARAPRRSGRLAGSVRGNRAVSRATVSAGRAAIPYAGPIHYGWAARGIEANPFVTDAAQQTESVWLPLYEAALQQLADQVG